MQRLALRLGELGAAGILETLTDLRFRCLLSLIQRGYDRFIAKCAEWRSLLLLIGQLVSPWDLCRLSSCDAHGISGALRRI